MTSLKPRLLVVLVLFGAACAPAAAHPPATASSLPATAVTSAEYTATPSAVPTVASPTPTRLPAARIFSEAFDGPVPYWNFVQAGNSQPLAAPVIRDGFLVFDLTARDQWAYAVYGGAEYGDVTIEAQVQDRSGGDGAAGLVCRYNKNVGWYELDVHADGNYQLLFGQWLADGVATYTPLYRGQVEGLQADENAIGLQCQKNTLTPSVNGRPLRRWQEAKFGLQRGKIGLSVSSFAEVPLTIAFDSIKVSEP